MWNGLIRKTLYETLGFTLLLGVGLLGFHALIAYIAPAVFAEFSDHLLRMMFVKTLLKGLFGQSLDQLGPATIATISWMHPFPLALLWAHAIAFWSRTPAGEIEHGTIDFFWSQPVSRWAIVTAEALMAGLFGLILIAASLAGYFMGSRWIDPEHRHTWINLLKIAVNLYGLYLAVGGIAFLCSSFSNRRGAAMGLSFAVVASSYLIHTLAPFWSPIQTVAFLSLMNYYNPLEIVRFSAWPWGHLFILAGIASTAWLAAAWVASRRDIPSL